ncbi:signal peptide peptidase SppA [Synechococcus sp. PCC 7336]|uniref:signal peptide peptidase SppA n=1 Tax=Synechococcus sp. PCC 7336 TaxID=195250 RepID=UPI00034609B0|nr:signal peptide peptidase SppA [Synechococcus sp. PCC 7336]
MWKLWSFNKRRQIARIEIEGAIDGRTRSRVLKAIQRVEEEQFSALLLRIDSPGGTVVDSHEIYQALKHLQEKDIPILASFGNISASGGVYIAMGASHIMSNPGTITGSVGVILRGNNLERLLDKVGISFKVIKSGPYKDILSFDRELTPSEQQILQSLIDTTYNQFVATIAEARKLSLATVHAFADGRIFTGEQALELGMVDRLGTEADARQWAAELVDLDPDEAKFVELGKPKKFGLLGRLIPGQQLWQRLRFELTTSGIPLWLYWP